MSRFSETFNRLIRRGYPLIFAFVFIFHVAFSAFPAYLMHRGRTDVAVLIYKYFRILCHQLPQRSYFLFGPQAYYPLSVSEGGELLSFEEAAGFAPDLAAGRAFYGTPEMGYKMAICQRDTAIYSAMALFSLIFMLTGNRVRRPHWAFPVLIGLLPMTLDGVSQLLGNTFPGVFPLRESTPLLRTVTGALFGFCLCWYLFPFLEQSLREGEKE